MQNFRHVLAGLDPKPLLAQLAGIPTAERHEEGFPYHGPVKWRRITEWTWRKAGTAVYQEYNIPLRFVPIRLDHATGTISPHEKQLCSDAPALLTEAWPLVRALYQAVEGKYLGHVIITRLPPGGKIGRHIDEWHAPCPPYWIRHQIPLLAKPGVNFKIAAEEKYLEPTNAFAIDNQKPHSVDNDSDDWRISIVVDIHQPNTARVVV